MRLEVEGQSRSGPGAKGDDRRGRWRIRSSARKQLRFLCRRVRTLAPSYGTEVAAGGSSPVAAARERSTGEFKRRAAPGCRIASGLVRGCLTFFRLPPTVVYNAMRIRDDN